MSGTTMSANERYVGALSREQIVRFAGAIQDFNPIHYDDEVARKAGLPSAIAHGPLTFLIALDALFADRGVGGVTGFQVRLKAPVTPGTPLSVAFGSEGEVVLKAGDAEALVGKVTFAEAVA